MRHSKTDRKAYLKAYKQRKKDACFAAYGGYVCICCGETEKVFLTLDHVNGGGTQQRKQGLRGEAFYQWLIRNGFPPGIQVLCANCNLGKHLNGVCPHRATSHGARFTLHKR